MAAKSDHTKLRPVTCDQSVVWDLGEAGQMAQTQLGGPLLPSPFLLPAVSVQIWWLVQAGAPAASHPGPGTDLMMETTWPMTCGLHDEQSRISKDCLPLEFWGGLGVCFRFCFILLANVLYRRGCGKVLWIRKRAGYKGQPISLNINHFLWLLSVSHK